ncbi:glycosyltransferase family 4 protein [Dyadobacter jiangsuensis]
MKVLIIHTNYTNTGGEDTVFSEEVKLLRQAHEVEALTFANSSGPDGLVQFLFSGFNLKSVRIVRRAIQKFEPDVIHIHNWHFAAGPMIIRCCARSKRRVFVTLHNYRLICPSASLTFNGKIFLNSVKDDFPWKAVKYGVYRGSRLLTFVLAATNWIHKKVGTWGMVDKYIALTDFGRNIFISSHLGIAPDKIVVKPNFTNSLGVGSFTERKAFYLFVGRLTEEKGVKVLLDAFKSLDESLVIIGSGPLERDVREAVYTSPNITYLGPMDRMEVQNMMKSARALIFPSIWFEGMPMTIIEAFAAGTPVIASQIGAMSTLIQDRRNGLHFEPGSPQSLMNSISLFSALGNSERESYYTEAHNSYLRDYTSQKNLELLTRIYNAE